MSLLALLDYKAIIDALENSPDFLTWLNTNIQLSGNPIVINGPVVGPGGGPVNFVAGIQTPFVELIPSFGPLDTVPGHSIYYLTGDLTPRWNPSALPALAPTGTPLGGITGNTLITSVGNTITVTPIVGGYNLEVNPAAPSTTSVTAGAGITVTGDGSTGTPYIITATGGGGAVASVTSGNSAIVIGGTATNPTVGLAPASPLLPEVVAGANVTSVVQTFDGIDGHAIYTVNIPAAGLGTVTSVTSGNSAIVVGGTATDPTISLAPASPLLPEVVAGANVTSVVQTFDGIDGHAIYTVNIPAAGLGTVTSVTSGNSAIVVGGTATDPTISLAPASPLLPEVVAGTNVTSVVQTFDGIDGHAIYTVNIPAAGLGTVTSVTSGNSGIVIGGTATDPTVSLAPASPLLPEVVAGTNVTSVVQTFDGIDGHAIYTVNAAGGGTGTVTSVTAGNASIVVAGTATDPTIAVAPNFVTTAALSGILVTGGPTGPYNLALDPVNFPSLAFWDEGTSVVAGKELSSWTPINAAADADIALLPKGVGGISMRNYATSTNVGGLLLGAGSVDLQATSAVGNVGYVTGTNSGVFAGLQGIVTGSASAIVGGGSTTVAQGNTITAGIASVILGGLANAINATTAAAVVGGQTNTASAVNAICAGGNLAIASGLNSATLGGLGPNATGNRSAVVGGISNDATNTGSAILGGDSNTASGIGSAIIGGILNTASNQYSAVGAGNGNTVDGPTGFIAAGVNNAILLAVSNGFIGGGTAQNAAGTNGTTNIASVGGSHTTNSASNSLMTGAFGISKPCASLEDGNKIQLAGGSASNPELITVLGRNKVGQGAIVTSALHSTQHSTSALYMEWDDQSLKSVNLKRGNLVCPDNKQSLLGYMVAMTKEGFVTKANALDDVVGVSVSGDDGLVGGGQELFYRNKYQRDAFGSIVTKSSYIERICDLINVKTNGTVSLDQEQLVNLQFATPKEICAQFVDQLDAKHVDEILAMEHEPRQVALLSNKYDATLSYTCRSGRVEWSPVAHTGSAVVRDDGSCIVGQRCIPLDGIAVASSSNKGYRIISRLGQNTVTILL